MNISIHLNKRKDNEHLYSLYKVSYMVDYKVIGDRIKKKRLQQKMTQLRLSEELNVSPEYVSRIESGKAKINLEMLYKISYVLKVPPEFFIAGTSTKGRDYLSAEISDALKECTVEQTQVIEKIIKLISSI